MRWAVVRMMVLLALAMLSAPGTSRAQPAAKIPRIGVLWFGSPAVGPAPHLEAFRQGLHELGYVEGENIAIESRQAAMRPERLPELAANLVLSQVDIIVAVGDPAIQAARGASSSMPIVMVAGSDPVGSGLIASLAQPGGNITGLSVLSRTLSGKRLQLLSEALPGLSRVALLWNPTDPAKALEVQELQAAGQTLGLQLQLLPVQGAGDFAPAFAAMQRAQAEALIILGDALTVSHRLRLIDLAQQQHLPTMYDWHEFVEAGGFMAYGPSLPDLFRRAAAYVDKILRGARPAILPVEQPMKFTLSINLKAAKALNRTMPPLLLYQADQVLQ